MVSPFEKIEEGAYFAIDFSSFSLGVTLFDPLLAAQTICYTWQEFPEPTHGLPEPREEELRLAEP